MESMPQVLGTPRQKNRKHFDRTAGATSSSRWRDKRVNSAFHPRASLGDKPLFKQQEVMHFGSVCSAAKQKPFLPSVGGNRVFSSAVSSAAKRSGDRKKKESAKAKATNKKPAKKKRVVSAGSTERLFRQIKTEYQEMHLEQFLRT